MKMITLQVQAKDVPVDTFILLPKKNLFLFVHNIVHYENKLEFVFELDHEQEIAYSFLYNEMVSVVADYSTETKK
jgi:hypothetical protein